MDDIRDSFSRFKKGVKHQLTGRKRKEDQPETEGNETSGSVIPPEASVVTGDGHEREGGWANANDERVERGAAVDENGSEWKATVSASAKLLLRGVGDSADTFGPLKLVAGGLCFILENYEVCFPCDVYLQCSLALQSTKANKQPIESLAPRVRALAESLSKPVSEGDAREWERRQKLER